MLDRQGSTPRSPTTGNCTTCAPLAVLHQMGGAWTSTRRVISMKRSVCFLLTAIDDRLRLNPFRFVVRIAGTCMVHFVFVNVFISFFE